MADLMSDNIAGPSINVLNGGLILLWPFLSRYFAALELTEDDVFISRVAQLRAVQFSEFLIRGVGDTLDDRLALNKCLCGVSGCQPIDGAIEPSAAEAALAQDLLLNLTRHWAPLRNTSIEGLREAFLSRPAQLSSVGNVDRLSVDKEPYDMLLDQLPWPIHTIRLRWMERPLEVRWYG